MNIIANLLAHRRPDGFTYHAVLTHNHLDVDTRFRPAARRGHADDGRVHAADREPARGDASRRSARSRPAAAFTSRATFSIWPSRPRTTSAARSSTCCTATPSTTTTSPSGTIRSSTPSSPTRGACTTSSLARLPSPCRDDLPSAVRHSAAGGGPASRSKVRSGRSMPAASSRAEGRVRPPRDRSSSAGAGRRRPVDRSPAPAPTKRSCERRWAIQSAGAMARAPLDAGAARSHMPAQDVFVLPTRFEGFPVALVEAMGAGLVPVVSDIASGVPEIVVKRATRGVPAARRRRRRSRTRSSDSIATGAVSRR